jgi:hypothetical protein
MLRHFQLKKILIFSDPDSSMQLGIRADPHSGPDLQYWTEVARLLPTVYPYLDSTVRKHIKIVLCLRLQYGTNKKF